MSNDAPHQTEARGRMETEDERADRRFTDILQELRVTLTGTQLTSGFLLAVAFQSGFPSLSQELRVHYLVLVGLAALATVLGLAPVMVHRLNSGRQVKDRVVRLANHLLITTLIVVSLLVIGVTSFIFEVVVSAVAGLWAAAAAVAILLLLWWIAAAAHRIERDPMR